MHVLGVVLEWRHAILNIFRPPSPHLHAFYYFGLSTVVTKLLTPSPVTSFMDETLSKSFKNFLKNRIADIVDKLLFNP